MSTEKVGGRTVEQVAGAQGGAVFGLSKPYLKMLQNKWEQAREGVEDRYTRDIVLPILLENQANAATSGTSGMQMLGEDTTSANIQPYPAFVYPLVRRVFPSLIANEIVSVQPMVAPVGAVFYLDATYTTSKNGITAGQNMFYQTPFSSTYSQSSLTATGSLGTGDGSIKGFAGTLTSLPIQRGSVIVTSTVASATVTFTDDGEGHLSDGGSGTGLVDYFGGTILVSFSTAPDTGAAVNYAYTQFQEATSTNIGGVSYKISMKTLQATDRKLNASYSVESMNDFRAYWGEDADENFVAWMAADLNTEVDRTIVNDLINTANGNTGSLKNTWTQTPASGLYPQGSAEWIRTLVTQLGLVSNAIYKQSFNAQANFIVTGPTVNGLLSVLPEMKVENASPVGVAKVGVLANKYRSYINVYQNEQQILIGYQGSNIFDTGYIFAPYVPVSFSPVFYDPSDFTLKRGAYTRYARKLIRSYYYGMTTVTDI